MILSFVRELSGVRPFMPDDCVGGLFEVPLIPSGGVTGGLDSPGGLSDKGSVSVNRRPIRPGPFAPGSYFQNESTGVKHDVAFTVHSYRGAILLYRLRSNERSM